jgi:hypothetical protein
MYNFSTSEWVERLFLPEHQASSYYDFSPSEGWRVVVMDSYEICVMQPAGTENRAEAIRALEENNPNDVINGGNWFQGDPTAFKRQTARRILIGASRSPGGLTAVPSGFSKHLLDPHT